MTQMKIKSSPKTNPYHKPAGTYTPVVDPPPVHKLSVQDRFKLMFGYDPTEKLHVQAQCCKHGVPFRWECYECADEN